MVCFASICTYATVSGSYRRQRNVKCSAIAQTREPAAASRPPASAPASLPSVVQRPEPSGRPYLVLAPMEVLGDAQFRLGMSVIGGFDEAVREFMRIPHGCDERGVRGVLRRRFDSNELAHAGIPLAAQIMCGEPGPAGYAANLLATQSGAPRIDLNCGCPSRRVNSEKHGCETGAGASLLREPDRLHNVARAMVDAVEGCDAVVSVKMRSGFNDASAFDDCVCAAREAGISMLTVHGRTRKQGYDGLADWGVVKRAVALCKGSGVQVVGNGDCCTGGEAIWRAGETGCDGVMIGRGAVANSHIFWEARRMAGDPMAHEIGERTWEREKSFLLAYFAAGVGISPEVPESEMLGRVEEIVAHWGPARHVKAASRLKMIAAYTDWGVNGIRESIRRRQCNGDSVEFLQFVIEQMRVGFEQSKEKVG